MPHRTRVKRLPAIAMLGLLAVLAGCGSSSTSLAAFQPEINNAPDNVQRQATAVSNVSTTLRYSWSNTGTRATVNHASADVRRLPDGPPAGVLEFPRHHGHAKRIRAERKS